MKKTVVIHQPDFLPHLAFLHRLLAVDLWIVLDHVQFSRGGWVNRDRIKTPQGAAWLTVGVAKAPLDTAIRDVALADDGWRRKNLDLLRQNYRDAPCFREVFPSLEALYAEDCGSLLEFNLKSIDLLLAAFGLRVPRVLSSELGGTGTKNELLVALLRRAGATRYLSGPGARAYYRPEPFRDAGIEVLWQSFEHPSYPQLHGQFISYLSSIDLLLNCGPARAREILRSCA